MSELLPDLKIERRLDTRVRLNVSKSTEVNREHEGLITSVFSLGGRAVGRFEHETTAIMAAMGAGKSDDDIRILVKSLHEVRKTLFEISAGEYAIST